MAGKIWCLVILGMLVSGAQLLGADEHAYANDSKQVEDPSNIGASSDELTGLCGDLNCESCPNLVCEKCAKSFKLDRETKKCVERARKLQTEGAFSGYCPTGSERNGADCENISGTGGIPTVEFTFNKVAATV
jgi:hypothetical protein